MLRDAFLAIVEKIRGLLGGQRALGYERLKEELVVFGKSHYRCHSGESRRAVGDGGRGRAGWESTRRMVLAGDIAVAQGREWRLASDNFREAFSKA